MNTAAIAEPTRARAFDSIQQAEDAVARLWEAGFGKPQLAVVCSEHVVKKYFQADGLLGEQPPDALKRAQAGGIIGSVLGLVGPAGLATSGGIGVMAAGFLVPAVIRDGVAESFEGAMIARGLGAGAAHFHSQMVESGKLLVVVEDRSETAEKRLRLAEEILARPGAQCRITRSSHG